MSPMVSRPFSMEYALLGLLRHGPQHGYQLHLQVNSSAGLGSIWRIKQSQFYALLTKLEQANLIASAVQAQDSRPPRRVFHLTPDGEKAFLEWVQAPVTRPFHIRQEFMAKLYFACQETESVVSTLIERQLVVSRKWLRDTQLVPNNHPDQSVFDTFIHRYRRNQVQMIIDWLISIANDLDIPCN